LSPIFTIEKRDYITQYNNIDLRHTCFVVSSCRVLAFCSSSSCKRQGGYHLVTTNSINYYL